MQSASCHLRLPSGFSPTLVPCLRPIPTPASPHPRVPAAAERDPEFLQKFEKVAPKNKKVIVMCAVGGTLDTIVKVIF